MNIQLPAVGSDLPVHPFTGLTAIGLRRNGAPIWPVKGGADDGGDGDDDAGSSSTGDDDQDDPDGADKLGDAGKKALDAMKSKWQSERDRRKALEQELATLKAQQGKDDDQPDPEEIRKQAHAEARAEVLRDRALDKVEAKAAKSFADPEDARALLASRVDEFVDDGKVDVEAIEEALDDLLKKKPHLAAQGGRRFQGSADGGARKGSKPAQLTRDDLKGMSPEAIVKAKAEGRLNDLLGIK